MWTSPSPFTSIVRGIPDSWDSSVVNATRAATPRGQFITTAHADSTTIDVLDPVTLEQLCTMGSTPGTRVLALLLTPVRCAATFPFWCDLGSIGSTDEFLTVRPSSGLLRLGLRPIIPDPHSSMLNRILPRGVFASFRYSYHVLGIDRCLPFSQLLPPSPGTPEPAATLVGKRAYNLLVFTVTRTWRL